MVLDSRGATECAAASAGNRLEQYHSEASRVEEAEERTLATVRVGCFAASGFIPSEPPDIAPLGRRAPEGAFWRDGLFAAVRWQYLTRRHEPLPPPTAPLWTTACARWLSPGTRIEDGDRAGGTDGGVCAGVGRGNARGAGMDGDEGGGTPYASYGAGGGSARGSPWWASWLEDGAKVKTRDTRTAPCGKPAPAVESVEYDVDNVRAQCETQGAGVGAERSYVQYMRTSMAGYRPGQAERDAEDSSYESPGLRDDSPRSRGTRTTRARAAGCQTVLRP
ncbi:hypothetical protein B0H13DRAFT_2406450 [Mycena leptocephala]|nr:hypothetical protein B0H13DRAFT_2406450 [Mycena leptocephala]